jgi:hypothetical protein
MTGQDPVPENFDRDDLAMQKYGEGMFGIYVDTLNELPASIVDEAAELFDNYDVQPEMIEALYTAADDAQERGETDSPAIQLRDAFHTMSRVGQAWTSEHLKKGKP